MGNALTRGRTLNPKAVEDARKWREDRIKHLNSLFTDRRISRKQLHELRHLTGKVTPPFI